MSKLVLVRHGQSMANAGWDDAYKDDRMNFLTPMGIAQAEVAGWKLDYSGIKFKHMISSGMTRARQTMAIIAHITKDWMRDFAIDEKLNERNGDPGIDEKSEYTRHQFACVASYQQIILPRLADGNTLVVTHHYTMERIIECMGLKLWEDRSPRIPNCVAYVFEDNKLLVKFDDETKTPRMREGSST